MEQRPFGDTGLTVSALGLGTGKLGSLNVRDGDAERLLNTALDLGITFIDTAPSYGLAEERIGRFLAHRRDAFVLSTKVGYGIPGIPDWTYEAVAQGVDEALRKLRVDVIDVVYLHSCPRETLERTDVIDALEVARDMGKVRAIGYAGENDALAFALSTRRFDAIQTSLNLFDQGDLDDLIPQAEEDGVGIVGKRPLANAPWRFDEAPGTHDEAPYWERMQAMDLDIDLPWHEVAIRFAAHTTGAHTSIVGTADLDHLRANIEAVEQGPLPDDLVEQIRSAFAEHSEDWEGIV